MAKVLIVDDSASMRQMVAFTLKDSGYDVMEAEDGQQGLTTAEGNSFDLVISDVNMPVMDGITMIGKIRALSAYQYTPILMLTTESSGEKKTLGKQAGATGWIVKPFKPEMLIETIKKVL